MLKKCRYWFQINIFLTHLGPWNQYFKINITQWPCYMWCPDIDFCLVSSARKYWSEINTKNTQKGLNQYCLNFIDYDQYRMHRVVLEAAERDIAQHDGSWDDRCFEDAQRGGRSSATALVCPLEASRSAGVARGQRKHDNCDCLRLLTAASAFGQAPSNFPFPCSWNVPSGRCIGAFLPDISAEGRFLDQRSGSC